VIVAHIVGVPVEETLLPVVGGLSAALAVAASWMRSRVRHPEAPRRLRRGRCG
jgi:hypothetical protein